jgi:hypothetical protein
MNLPTSDLLVLPRAVAPVARKILMVQEGWSRGTVSVIRSQRGKGSWLMRRYLRVPAHERISLVNVFSCVVDIEFTCRGNQAFVLDDLFKFPGLVVNNYDF